MNSSRKDANVKMAEKELISSPPILNIKCILGHYLLGIYYLRVPYLASQARSASTCDATCLSNSSNTDVPTLNPRRRASL